MKAWVPFPAPAKTKKNLVFKSSKIEKLSIAKIPRIIATYTLHIPVQLCKMNADVRNQQLLLVNFRKLLNISSCQIAFSRLWVLHLRVHLLQKSFSLFLFLR
jgi:hypothetical protein